MQDHPQIKAFAEAAFHTPCRSVLAVTWQPCDPGIYRMPPSVGLILMSCLDHRIEQLIAEPYDSRNTGAKGYCNT